jgi:hypothetical protein
MRLHGEDATYNSIQVGELPSWSTFVHSYQRIISVRGEKDRQEQRSPTQYHDLVSVAAGLGFYSREGMGFAKHFRFNMDICADIDH